MQHARHAPVTCASRVMVFLFSPRALWSLDYGLCFPHESCPFLSIPNSVPSCFYTRISQLQIVIIYAPSSRSSFFLPAPALLSIDFFTVLSPLILTACVLNYMYNIWQSEFIINLLIYFYFPGTISKCWPYVFLSIFLSHITNVTKMETSFSEFMFQHNRSQSVVQLLYEDVLFNKVHPTTRHEDPEGE